jgi:hypothetical protein
MTWVKAAPLRKHFRDGDNVRTTFRPCLDDAKTMASTTLWKYFPKLTLVMAAKCNLEGVQNPILEKELPYEWQSISYRK